MKFKLISNYYYQLDVALTTLNGINIQILNNFHQKIFLLYIFLLKIFRSKLIT
jgi:hypothetical protein